jgi:hypothetical protein
MHGLYLLWWVQEKRVPPAQVAGILVFWLGQGVTGLLLATLLVALGDAFRSGADQALLPAVVALSFLFGVAYPLRAAAIQRLAVDRMRARAASTASAFDKAFTAIGLVCAGLLPRTQ